MPATPRPPWISFGEPFLIDDGSSCKLRVNWQNQPGNRVYEVHWRKEGSSSWYSFYYGYDNHGSMQGFGLGLTYYFRVRSYTDHWSAWSASVYKVIDSQWGSSKSWNYDPTDSAKDDKYGSYSPYTGKTQIYKYFSSGKNRINLWSFNKNFDSSAIKAIKDYKSSDGWYYTWDQSVNDDYDTTLSAYINAPDGFTNFPSPYKYDTDDDGGNNYRDETEVTVENTSLNTTTDYFMQSFFTWYPDEYKTATLQSSSQMSKWYGWPINEYNTQTYGYSVTAQKYPWADWF